MEKMNFRGKWTLVTGASSGLGREMARALAKDYGSNLVVVARREDRLSDLKAELESKYQVQVVSITADLAKPDQVQMLFEQATRDRIIYAAVLNAGVTFYGNVLEQSPEAFDAMLSTNVTSAVQLATRFAQYFSNHSSGSGLMMVSSMAGFSPMPYQTAYAATKSFVTSFGLGLSHELKGKGTSVTVVAPGGIDTEMLKIAGLSKKFKSGDIGVMSPKVCARLSLESFASRRSLFIPGILNQAMALAFRLIPQRLLLTTIARVYKDA